MIHIIQTGIAWAFALTLLLIYPLSEFARGMASNPDGHPRSRGAMVLSAVGLALIVGLLW